MLEQVTFGITTFERPAQLQKLVTSITSRFPGAKIRIANNGKKRVKFSVPKLVQMFLPFDVGASACRNCLLTNSDTEYVYLLDDDFVFTEETRVAPMVDVLRHDQSIGVVGGSVKERRAQAKPCCNFKGMEIVPVSPPKQRTTAGTEYVLCDYIRMFALFRANVVETTRWREELKIGGEHRAFFYDLRKRGVWKVAWTPASTVHHDIHVGDKSYKKYRARAGKFQQVAFNSLRKDQAPDG